MADDKGPGVYMQKGGGWKASITKPDGTVQDLGDFSSWEAARAKYLKISGELYPLEPPPPPGAKVVSLRAVPLVTKAPQSKFKK